MTMPQNSTLLQATSSHHYPGMMASQVLLFIGALNLTYATVDIYDDTVKRSDERSDAYRARLPNKHHRYIHVP